MKTTAPVDEVYQVIHTDHPDPFKVLGPHLVKGKTGTALAVRAFIPDADTLSVILPSVKNEGREYAMEKVHDAGFYEVIIPKKTVSPYQLKMRTSSGAVEVFNDSYSFLPTLSETDLYLFNKGDHHRGSGRPCCIRTQQRARS